MTKQEDSQVLLQRKELKRLKSDEVGPYLTRLSSGINQLSRILTREKDSFIFPYLSIIRDTLECLQLKHLLTGRNQLDFSLTIDPNDAGFPAFKDLYLLVKDKEIADETLKKIPPRGEIIKNIKEAIFRGDPSEKYQTLLMKYNFFRKVLETNLLKDYHLNEPKGGGEEGNRVDYTLEWNCIERMSSIPVFYRLWLRQDKNDIPLDVKSKPELENIIYMSTTGIDDLKTIISCMDQLIGPIHPKLIYKYYIGPYYDSLTNNTPELSELFKGVENPSLLKFRVERVASVGTRKKSTGIIKKWFGTELEKEYYGGVDKSDVRMIVPFRIAQKLKNKDEYGNSCKVYGVTEGGEVTI